MTVLDDAKGAAAHPAAALPTKKVAIVGTCPSRVEAPFEDPSWEIWTIGPGGKNANRWERLLEVHGTATWPVGYRRQLEELQKTVELQMSGPTGARVMPHIQALQDIAEAYGTDNWPDGFDNYMDELAQVQPPKIIYTSAPVPEWPAHVVYPRDMMFAKYGRMWFTSQISYGIALALEEGATHIGCWGIDLESGEEYISQFAGAKYFLQLARLAGVEVTLPVGCGLLRDPNPYPDSYETDMALTIDAKIKMLEKVVMEKRAQHGNLAAEINHIDGELAAFQFLRQRYVIQGMDPVGRVPKIR